MNRHGRKLLFRHQLSGWCPFALDYAVPDEEISIKVDHGNVTLNGTADWYYQRDAAEDDATMISGVISVNDQLRVTQPQASVTNISSGVARAFVRNAKLYDDNVNVDVECVCL